MGHELFSNLWARLEREDAGATCFVVVVGILQYQWAIPCMRCYFEKKVRNYEGKTSETYNVTRTVKVRVKFSLCVPWSCVAEWILAPLLLNIGPKWDGCWLHSPANLPAGNNFPSLFSWRPGELRSRYGRFEDGTQLLPVSGIEPCSVVTIPTTLFAG